MIEGRQPDEADDDDDDDGGEDVNRDLLEEVGNVAVGVALGGNLMSNIRGIVKIGGGLFSALQVRLKNN